MFYVSTHRGDKEFTNFDAATGWARFMGKTYDLDGITVTHEGNRWELRNWYGKPEFRMITNAN